MGMIALEMSVSVCCSVPLSRNPISVNRSSVCTLPAVVTTNSMARLEGTRVTYAESVCVTPQRRCWGQPMRLLSVAIVTGEAFLGNMCKNTDIKKLLFKLKIWSLTLRQERGLRVFENRVLRRIFGRKKNEVTREWRKLHNEELSDMYFSPNIVRVIKSRRMRWARHVARMVERRSVYRVLVGKPEGKRPLGRLRRRWEDNIKMDIQEVEFAGMHRIEMAQDTDRLRALVNAVMNPRVP